MNKWYKIGEFEPTRTELFINPAIDCAVVMREGEKIAQFEEVTTKFVTKLQKQIETNNFY